MATNYKTCALACSKMALCDQASGRVDNVLNNYLRCEEQCLDPRTASYPWACVAALPRVQTQPCQGADPNVSATCQASMKTCFPSKLP
jgi:hypothetical protein